jgi:hypothetical protein
VSDDLQICGWRVSSELALTGLARWQGDDREPDVQILQGDVADDFIADRTRIALDAQDKDLCRFYVPQVGLFEIRNGSKVIVQMEAGALRGDLHACLTGTVLGMLSLLQNLLPLHASSVLMGGRAICFLGHSGAGKSTLAAALARRGHALLTDDVCAIDVTAAHGPVVLPSGSVVRLADRSQGVKSTLTCGGERLGADRVKQHVRFTPAQTRAVPMGTVYRLEKLQCNVTQSVREIAGKESLVLIFRDLIRYDVAKKLGMTASLFASAARLCSFTRVCILSRRFELSSLGETVDLLERLHCGAKADP